MRRSIDPVKFCEVCGEQLVRPYSGGRLESPARFAARRFCSQRCHGASRIGTGKSLAERFWPKVDKRGPDECWPWTAGATDGGYGRINSGGAGEPTICAHRTSWELHNGPIPVGEGFHGTCVLHRCDNRLCVNPAHLFLGTQADNLDDCRAKGRRVEPTGERNFNAKLTEAEAREIIASEDDPRLLAKRYGVRRAHIRRIQTGARWKHLARATKEGAELVKEH